MDKIKALFKLITTVISKYKWVSLVAIVVAVSGFIGAQQVRIHRLQSQLYSSNLSLDSLQASTDTLRELKGVSDSTSTYWQQRAIQLKDINSNLEKELNQQIVIADSFKLKLDSLEINDTTQNVEITDTLATAHFEQYQEPVTIKSDVSINLINKDATALFKVKVDPITMNLYVGCQDGENNFKKAQVTVGLPSWATPEITSIQQTSEVCNPYNANNAPTIWGIPNSYAKWGIPILFGATVYIVHLIW